ncbi:MAG: hypothetical protein J6X65_02210 [Bacteroidales bacterium]|nr:hypothetical protein [Bacteroidales bacterium]
MRKGILTIMASALILMLAGTLTSCGSGSESSDTEIKKGPIKLILNDNIVNVKSGWLSADEEYQFFESVQGAYELAEKDGKLEITLDFKRTKDADVEMTDFYLEPYRGVVSVSKLGKSYKFQTDKKAAFEKLQEAEEGEAVSITFTYIPADDEEKSQIFSETDGCKVYFEIPSGKSSSSFSRADDDDDDEVSSSSSSTDWDDFLDDYEDYVDQYISLMKKAKNGDMSAVSEYPSMLSKAESMQSKIDNAKGEMTSAQIARYSKISAKLAKAAY